MFSRNNHKTMDIAIDKKNRELVLLKVNYWLDRFFPWIAFLVFIIVLAIGWGVILQNNYNNLQRSMAFVPKMDQQIKSYRQEAGAVGGNIDRTINFSESDDKLLSLALPSNPDFSSIMIQIDNAARKNNFLANDIKMGSVQAYDKKDASSKIKKVDLSVSLAGGSYDNLKTFISDLEKSLMSFDVISIQFGGGKESSGGYNLNLVVYYYPEN